MVEKCASEGKAIKNNKHFCILKYGFIEQYEHTVLLNNGDHTGEVTKVIMILMIA